MKIKCVKAECPSCKLNGSIQLFLNRSGEVRYARTRHYSHLAKDSKKPQFTYCGTEDLEALQTLIKSQGISLSVNEVEIGQVGQGQIHDQYLQKSIPKSCGRSLVWLGHQPPTLTTRVQIPATALIFHRTSPLQHLYLMFRYIQLHLYFLEAMSCVRNSL